MKNIILFATLILLATAASYAQVNKLTGNNTQGSAKIVWDKETFEFGEIPQGVPVSTTFKLTNNGTAPLLISDVKTSCGCTAPSFTKEPILPGKSGIIKLQYNAASIGAFNKSATVFTNVGEKQLTISGTVKEASN